jgi:hypothetical protein
VTHKPVYHKTIFNTYTAHDNIQKDVYHHLHENEVPAHVNDAINIIDLRTRVHLLAPTCSFRFLRHDLTRVAFQARNFDVDGEAFQAGALNVDHGTVDYAPEVCLWRAAHSAPRRVPVPVMK